MSINKEQIQAFLAEPALPAPDGITPEFDNPSNRNGLAWFVTKFCLVVSTLCLFLRTWVRTIKQKKLHIEESMSQEAHAEKRRL